MSSRRARSETVLLHLQPLLRAVLRAVLDAPALAALPAARQRLRVRAVRGLRGHLVHFHVHVRLVTARRQGLGTCFIVDVVRVALATWRGSHHQAGREGPEDGSGRGRHLAERRSDVLGVRVKVACLWRLTAGLTTAGCLRDEGVDAQHILGAFVLAVLPEGSECRTRCQPALGGGSHGHRVTDSIQWPSCWCGEELVLIIVRVLEGGVAPRSAQRRRCRQGAIH
mmetsp:Transcript_130538/g.325667  ORF Transcript_130538/g.325667 Transcript_130538/m.325667 type:complete len:225 (-) Transcript_130538:103-777(-)